MNSYIERKKPLNQLSGWLMLVLSTFLFFSCTQKGQEQYETLLNEYNSAHEAQIQGNMESAAYGYRKCVEQCSQEKYLNDDSVKLLLPRAMGQLMNVYQSQGDLGGCVAYFDSLKHEVNTQPTIYNKVLCHQFRRDVYVLLAYSLSRTDKEKQAVLTMDAALKMPLSYPTPERLFRDYAYATGVYYCEPATQDKVFAYGKKALHMLKQCKKKSGAQWLVTMLGSMYHRTGQVDEAVRMYQEGYELALIAQDTLGMANAKKEMADYLLQWNLDSIADRYATQAVELLSKVANKNPMVETGVYVTKARILKTMHRKGDALFYLKKAKESSIGLPYNCGASDIGVLMGSLLVSKTAPCYPVDHAQGMALLENAAHRATYKIKATAFYELAKANLAVGKTAEGEVQLDSMYTILNASSTPIVLEGAYEYALNYYRKAGNQAKVALYTKALQSQRAMADRTTSIRNVINAVTQIEMDTQESSINEREEEMDRHKMVGLTMTIVLIVFALGLVAFTVWVQRRGKNKYRHTKLELLEARMKLKTAKRHQLSAEEKMATMENDYAEKLKGGQPLFAILQEEGEAKFREKFKLAYPAFLGNLRRLAPTITRKEECYCMLMALGINNVKVAEAFSVARSSVNIAKSRIRKKLPEAEKTKMEDFLSGLLRAEGE